VGSRRIGATLLVLFAWTCLAAACGKKERPAAAQDADPVSPKKPRPAASPGESPVDLVESKISLAVVKDHNANGPVVVTVLLRDGAISFGAGTARLSIDLDSIDSGVPLRNERLRGVLLETGGPGWDTAELRITSIPESALVALREKRGVGGVKIDGELALHGVTAKVPFIANVSFGTGGVLLVKSAAPVELKISDYGLGENLKKLITLCKHESIDDVVKVDFSLEFTPP
jgi:polyisoprenoid-binding protein YceI